MVHQSLHGMRWVCAHQVVGPVREGADARACGGHDPGLRKSRGELVTVVYIGLSSTKHWAVASDNERGVACIHGPPHQLCHHGSALQQETRDCRGWTAVAGTIPACYKLWDFWRIVTFVTEP